MLSSARQFEPPTLWTIDTDGANLTQLTELAIRSVPSGHPTASDRLLEQPGGIYEIFVMTADGTGITQLTTSPGADFNPTFSPDGQQIAWWKLRQPGDI